MLQEKEVGASPTPDVFEFQNLRVQVGFYRHRRTCSDSDAQEARAGDTQLLLVSLTFRMVAESRLARRSE